MSAKLIDPGGSAMPRQETEEEQRLRYLLTQELPPGLHTKDNKKFYFFCRSCTAPTILEGGIYDFELGVNNYCGGSPRCLP